MRDVIILAAVGIFSTSFALTSCQKELNTEDHVVSENFIMHTDTSYPEIEISHADKSDADEKQMRFSYALNGSTVELSIDGEVVTTLDFYYTPPMENIVVTDFDLDGYQDIFIPFEEPADCGSYYCYDKKSNSFVANEGLNAVGRLLKIQDDGLFISEQNDETKKRVVEYQWVEGELKALRKTETYVSAESGNTITDIYTYDEYGVEKLSETIKDLPTKGE